MKVAAVENAAWTLDESQLPVDFSPAQRAHAWLRLGIISGFLPPGQRITEEALTRAAGVSRTSLREALGVLTAEGYLRVQPYFGTFVADLTRRDADEVLELHAALEPMAAQGAARHASQSDISELRALVLRGRAAAAAGDQSERTLLHCQFHTRLAEASGNRSLAQMITQLGYKLQWAYAIHVQRPPGDSWDEHAVMVEAIADRSAERAGRAADEHIHRGLESRRETVDPATEGG